jgi:hypothetical protein
MPRLSGALLAMVVAAALVAVTGIAGSLLAFDQLRAIGGRYMLAVAFVTAWSILFLLMTALRARATPVVASAGLALWVAYRAAVAALSGGWPLVVDLLVEAVLAAGFCGYLLGGEQPGTYYRGRLPKP